jgi:hypothetical protein
LRAAIVQVKITTKCNQGDLISSSKIITGGDCMKVAVIGSRNAEPETYELILKQLPAGCSEIVSGGANGVDLLAKKAAKELGLKYTCCRPNYKKYGRVAPLVRNSDIVDRADCVIAFWNGYSKGTRQALVCCIKRRKPFRIYLLNSHNFICKIN